MRHFSFVPKVAIDYKFYFSCKPIKKLPYLPYHKGVIVLHQIHVMNPNWIVALIPSLLYLVEKNRTTDTCHRFSVVPKVTIDYKFYFSCKIANLALNENHSLTPIRYMYL
jgi:hypothetical protein